LGEKEIIAYNITDKRDYIVALLIYKDKLRKERIQFLIIDVEGYIKQTE